METSAMQSGKVKWFSDQKGYGFIVCDSDSSEVFVHYSGIEMEGFRTLQEGQKVSFDIEQGEKGSNAVNVKSVD